MYSYPFHNQDAHPLHYLSLQHENSAYDDFLESIAAEHFPLNDEKSLGPQTASPYTLSPFTASSSGKSSIGASPLSRALDAESDWDPDSDIEELVLDPTFTNPPSRPFSLVQNDTPYMPPSPVIASASTSTLPLTSNLSHDSLFSAPDIDQEPADDEGDATDDEYVPSPALAPKKRRRATPPARERLPPPKSESPVASTYHEERPKKKLRMTQGPRNRQTAYLTRIEMAAARSHLGVNLVCPECKWVQTNQRIPDFKRHLRTHAQADRKDQSKGWWCKGVWVEQRKEYKVPDEAESYKFLGVDRVGGCLTTFSRRDALKRHLDNKSISCFGKVGLPTDW